MDNINHCFSEQELAKKLDLSYWSVRHLRLQQGLPHFKCGRRVFYRMETVQKWFDSQEQSTSATAIDKIRRIN
jgi:hypothetical protein